jgi:enoyl-CoA hydratase/carnithine racemase
MDSNKIIYELKGNVAYITLNNPSKLNCIGFQMLYELEEALVETEEHADVNVVVFKGAGDRAFSTGADLKEFQSLSEKKIEEWIQLGNKVFNRVENLEKPTIAFINGFAIGGGLELALTCDFRIGTETAIFSSPELKHGWLPGWGGMTRLRRLLGEAKAKEVTMMCEKISVHKALNMGLISKVDSADEVILSEFIKHLKTINPKIFKLAKYALMEPGRTTYGTDVCFDVMATQVLK